jgi:hypothetical protein
MTDLAINITKYDPSHTDFENPEYFPASNLLTYNQMIDVLADPWVTLAACTLSGQIYLTTYGEGVLEPIQEVSFKDNADEELEALKQKSIVTYFSIDGNPFGSMMMAWDIYRKDVSDKRSKEADNLAKYLGINEDNTYNKIEYTPEAVLPATVADGDSEELAERICHVKKLELEIKELTTERSELLEQSDKLTSTIADRVTEVKRRKILTPASVTIKNIKK